jgi:hypothetical protein
MRTRVMTVLVVLLCISTAPFFLSSAQAVEEFHAFLTPDTCDAHQGGQILISFAVDSTARHFNGFTVVLGFDRNMVSLQSISEGSLMRQTCLSRYVDTSHTDSTVTFTSVFLCNQVFANGPGNLCTVRFQAVGVGTCPVRVVSNPDRTFFDDGVYVAPDDPNYPRQVMLSNAVILVEDALAAAQEPSGSDLGADALRLRIAPNPLVEGSRISLRVPDSAPVTLRILDVAGREVWEWSGRPANGSAFSLPWPGRDSDGRPLAAGVFFCQAATGSARAVTRVVVCR